MENNDDREDSASSVNPGEDELCDSIDNDCDGDTDKSSAIDAITTYLDEVVFFKRALTEEQIQRVVEGGSSYGHPLRF